MSYPGTHTVLKNMPQDPKQLESQFIQHLIRGICHDVGAPARHIVQFSQMLTDSSVGSTLEDKHKHWLSILNNSGRQLQSMLAGLETLTHLSNCAEKTSELDLRAIFDQALSTQQNKIVAGNSVTITINESWPRIIGSQELWQTLFNQLLANALTFQPKNLHHTIELHILCTIENSALKFVLEDNGIGANEHQKNEMLKAFKQLHAKDEYPGLGLGLTYCEYAAILNGGHLSFQDSPLGGLRVIYSQPMTD